MIVFRKFVEFLGAIPIGLHRHMWKSKGKKDKAFNWKKPPMDGDGYWHVLINVVDPDGDKFTKELHTIDTTRKLSPKGNLRDIIDWRCFYEPTE